MTQPTVSKKEEERKYQQHYIILPAEAWRGNNNIAMQLLRPAYRSF